MLSTTNTSFLRMWQPSIEQNKQLLFQKSQILQSKTELVESSTRIFLDGPSNNFTISSLLFFMVIKIFQTITIDSNTISEGISRTRDQRGIKA